MIQSFVVPTLLVLTLLGLPVSSASAESGRWRDISPDGGSVMALAAAPGAGNVYAFTGRGSVYHSSDGAASWSYRGTLHLHSFRGRPTVDPVRPEVLYALSGLQLVKSTDGGRSWSGPLIPANLIWSFALAPSDPDVIYVSRNLGFPIDEILKSTDGGASWTLTNPDAPIAYDLVIDPGDSRVLYAAAEDGVVRSTDGGVTWNEASAGLEDPDGGFVSIKNLAIDPRQPATLYAASGDTLYKSVNQGTTWSVVWKAARPFAGFEKLAIDPATGTVYGMVEYEGILRSSDGGLNWTQVFTSFGVRQALAVDPATPGRIYTGTEAGGAYVSQDGGGFWTEANHGLKELGFSAVRTDPHVPGVLFAAAETGSSFSFSRSFLLRSTDGGAGWASPFGSPDSSPSVHDLAADPSRPGIWYLASQGVWKTRDGGESWERASRGFRQIEYVRTVAVSSYDPDALYAIGWDTFPICGGSNCPRVIMYRSVDGAAQWRRARVPELRGFLPGSLALNPASASIVYTAAGGILQSRDGGVSWAEVGDVPRGFVSSLVADPFVPGVLYAAVFVPRGRRVYKSFDGGETWGPASSGLSVDLSVFKLVPDPLAPGTLYAATDRGVYVTKNRGSQWTPMNAGLEDVTVWDVAADPFRRGVFYAAGPEGLYEFSADPAELFSSFAIPRSTASMR